MPETLQILCLSPDPATAAGVAAMLASLPDFTMATRMAGYEDGLRDLREPDLAIVVLAEDPTSGLGVIEAVHRGAPSTQVLAVSPDEDPETIIKAMRAGADEHLSLPLSQHALLKVCIKVSELRRVGTPRSGGHGGELWVVYSPKGGVGVTTLAVNLAFALRAARRETALVDLDVYAGDVPLFLNLNPTYSLRDIAGNIKRLDSVFLQGTMIRHGSGMQLLPAPTPTLGESPFLLTRDQTVEILELLCGTYQVTVVDTPGIPNEAVRAALLAADRIILVTELSLPSIRGCLRTVDWLREEGVDVQATIDVVVNKYAKNGAEISPVEAGRTLNLPLRALLPYDAAALSAANTGMPVGEVRGGATLQRAIAALAARTPSGDDPGRGRMGGLFRLLSGAERRA